MGAIGDDFELRTHDGCDVLGTAQDGGQSSPETLGTRLRQPRASGCVVHAMKALRATAMPTQKSAAPTTGEWLSARHSMEPEAVPTCLALPRNCLASAPHCLAGKNTVSRRLPRAE